MALGFQQNAGATEDADQPRNWGFGRQGVAATTARTSGPSSSPLKATNPLVNSAVHPIDKPSFLADRRMRLVKSWHTFPVTRSRFNQAPAHTAVVHRKFHTDDRAQAAFPCAPEKSWWAP